MEENKEGGQQECTCLPIKLRRHIQKRCKHVGILYVICASFFLTLSMLSGKKVKNLTGMEVSWLRFCVMCVFIFPYAAIKQYKLFNYKGNRRWLFLRAVCAALGTLALFTSILLIPLPDATAVKYCSVALTPLFAAILLKEKMTFLQGLTIIVCFTGIVCIANPFGVSDRIQTVIGTERPADRVDKSFYPPTTTVINQTDKTKEENDKPRFLQYGLPKPNNEISGINKNAMNTIKIIIINHSTNAHHIHTHPSLTTKPLKTAITQVRSNKRKRPSSKIMTIGVLLASITSVCEALAYCVTRKMSCKGIPASVIVLNQSTYGNAICFSVCFLYRIVVASLPHLTTFDIGFILLTGISSVIGHLLLIKALHRENTGLVSIVRSLDIVFSFIYQYAFFHVKPNSMTFIGTALIVVAVVSVSFVRIKQQTANKHNRWSMSKTSVQANESTVELIGKSRTTKMLLVDETSTT